MDDPNLTSVTIMDIAKRAGVSVTTVSRILNNKPDVSAKTIAKVRAVMDELGYAPHISARRLASGRSNVIAVLPHATSSELGSITYEYLTGIVDGAETEDFSVNLLPRGTSQKKLTSLLPTGQFDGLILLQVQTKDWRVDTLRQNDRPFVLLGRTEDTEGVSFVDVDLIEGARQMIDRLFANGHRHVALVGNALNQPVRRFSAGLLHEGYEKGMADHGLTPVVVNADFSVAGIVAAIREGLERHPDTTCFFIGGHVAMPQVLNALRSDGIEVPAHVSLASILPDSSADLVMPRITTIDLPGRELGQQAARILIDRIKGGTAAQQVLLPPQIIWRDSVNTLQGQAQ